MVLAIILTLAIYGVALLYVAHSTDSSLRQFQQELALYDQRRELLAQRRLELQVLEGRLQAQTAEEQGRAAFAKTVAEMQQLEARQQQAYLEEQARLQAAQEAQLQAEQAAAQQAARQTASTVRRTRAS